MSVTITLLLPGESLPYADAIAESIRTVEPTFRFDEPFDFNTDDGTCPCRFGRKACGFEWSISEPEQGEAASRVAALDYRSSPDDARAAITVAAHIASLTGARLIMPDGSEIWPADALAWAARTLREIKRSSRKPKGPVVSAEETARAWLADIIGREVTFLFHAEPDIAIRYATSDTELIVHARRWTVIDADGRECGTRELRRTWTVAQTRDYPETFQRLEALLRSGPVVDATLDVGGCSITIAHLGGKLRIDPMPAFEWTGIEQLFASSDLWRLCKRDAKSVEVIPADDCASLRYRS